MGAPPIPMTPDEFAALANVSRETLSRLKLLVSLLTEWNARQNLVSASSLADVWRRHVWDSAQLVNFIPPDARTIADLGSGAGFPGLVLAELLRDRVKVTLYEATAKKCRFLEECIARLALPATVRNVRIEEIKTRESVDVVTARALAPLPKLLGYAHHFMGKDSVGLFLKGQNIVSELTEAHKSWRMSLGQHQSRSDPSGVIVEVRKLAPHVERPRSNR
jgi:16S rRNA (guanine527-N7)-methyltransferase